MEVVVASLVNAAPTGDDVPPARLFALRCPAGESVGLLRLHSTYRHDLKIYSSDEGRVQMTAAAFVKGFLDLEGELTPILASLIKTINTKNLLDDSVAAREVINSLKQRLTEALTAIAETPQPPGAAAPTADCDAGAAAGDADRSDSRSPTAVLSRTTSGGGEAATISAGAAGVSSGMQPVSSALSLQDIMLRGTASGGDAATAGGSGGGISDSRPSSSYPLGASAGASGFSPSPLPWALAVPSAAEMRAVEGALPPALMNSIAPTRSAALLRALQVIGPNPRAALHRLHTLIQSLVTQLTERLDRLQRLQQEAKEAAAALAAADAVAASSGVAGSCAASASASPCLRGLSGLLQVPRLDAAGVTVDTSPAVLAAVAGSSAAPLSTSSLASASSASAAVPTAGSRSVHKGTNRHRDSELERLVRHQNDDYDGEAAASVPPPSAAPPVDAGAECAGQAPVVASSTGDSVSPARTPRRDDASVVASSADAAGFPAAGAKPAAAGTPLVPVEPPPQSAAKQPPGVDDAGASFTDHPSFACCSGESLWLMCERWRKLSRDFYKPKKDTFDLSKVPDVYDCIKYDTVHNAGLGLAGMHELYKLAKAFGDIVVSQEYGITVGEKKDIAARICHHLLRKIFFDMTAVAVEDDASGGGSAGAGASGGAAGPAEVVVRIEPAPAAQPAAPVASAPAPAAVLNVGRCGTGDAVPVTAAQQGGTAQSDGCCPGAGVALREPPSSSASAGPATAAADSQPVSARSSAAVLPAAANVAAGAPSVSASPPPSSAVQVASGAATVSVIRRIQSDPLHHQAGPQPVVPTTPTSSTSAAAVSVAAAAAAAAPPSESAARDAAARTDGSAGRVAASTSAGSAAGPASAWGASPLSGLVVTLRRHRYAVHLRRKSAPCILCPGLASDARAIVNEGIHTINPAVGPPVPREWQPMSNLFLSGRAAAQGARGGGGVHAPGTATPDTPATESASRTASRYTGRRPASVLAATSAASSVTAAGGAASSSGLSACDDDGISDVASVSTTTAAGGYDRMPAGPVLVPSIRLRQRPQAAPSSATAAAASASPPSGTGTSGMPPSRSAGDLAATATALDDSSSAVAAGGTVVASIESASSLPLTVLQGTRMDGVSEPPAVAASSTGGVSGVASKPTASPAASAPRQSGPAGADGTHPTPTPPATRDVPAPARSPANEASSSAPGTAGPSDAVDGASGVPASTTSASGSSKIDTIMAAIAQDFHDVSETVHQLDARVMIDEGYGEVKTPTRHVRTRLYFTSESHVHALVNTIKYWAFNPEGDASGTMMADGTCSSVRAASAEPSPGASPPDASVAAPPPAAGAARGASASAAPVTRLTTPDTLGMLESTPELDYLTQIVFRLYENFRYPPGTPQRHRVEIHFSPGASFDPFDGQPRTPRRVPLSEGGDSRVHGAMPLGDEDAAATAQAPPAAGRRPPARTQDSEADLQLPSLDEMSAFPGVRGRAAVIPAAVAMHKVASITSVGGASTSLSTPGAYDADPAGYAVSDAVGGGTSSGALAALDESALLDGDVPDSASVLSDMRRSRGAPTALGSGGAPAAGGRRHSTSGLSTAYGDVRPPAAATVCAGPVRATRDDAEAHTLPVAGVTPVHLSLTLNDFEDVLAEAIYYGAQVHATEATELHPRDEAKARAAAKSRKAAADGYFVH